MNTKLYVTMQSLPHTSCCHHFK